MRRMLTPQVRFQGSFDVRRPFDKRKIKWFLLVALIVGGSTYLFLYTSVFAIQTINLQGFDQTNEETVRAQIQSWIDKKTLYLPIRQDILFFRTSAAEAKLANTFPSLVDIQITKQYPNSITVKGTERMPVGVWCLEKECAYYDAGGYRWGGAIASVGVLLTSVTDERPNQTTLDPVFFKAIQTVTSRLPSMGVVLQKIEIPADSFNEFKVYTASGYYLLFALDSNINDQVDVLRIFLDQKKSDPNFHPQQYIDLRLNGRVYFK